MTDGSKMKNKVSGLCKALVCIFFVFSCCHAYSAYGDSAWGYSNDMIMDMSQQDLLDRVIKNQVDLLREDAGSPASARPFTREHPLNTGNWIYGRRFEKERGIAYLAAIPGLGEKYEERKYFYRRVLLEFNKQVQDKYGIPINNLATGMTALLAGGYAAYSGQAFPDEWVKSLYSQVEKAMLKDPVYTQMPHSEKAYLYQVFVGTGMLLQLQQMRSGKNEEQVNHLRRVGGAILQKIINVSPERIDLSHKGISIKK